MAETVGQHSVAAFTSPVNGTSPIDANTVKGNDNTIRSAYVDHDADPGIHVQSSTLASRPAANSAGRKWMTADSGVVRLFYDDGTNWYEADYLRTTGGTISGNLAVTGTLNVTGVTTLTAQPVLSSLTASQAVFTDASKGLVSNAITGTGNVVMSASPTLTGTIQAAAASLSGALGVSGLLTFASLKGTGSTTVTDILNDGTMATASATTLATSASIKTYVDAQVGASDALSEVLAIGNTTGANDIIVSTGQKIRTPAVAAGDGSAAITIANTTGALTLATALADSNLATISTAGKVANSATTATNANTASAIVARDASGNFSAGTITATLNGAAPAGSLTGTTLASNVVTSSLTAVGTIATGVWQGTAISDTYLATISTAGKVANSATTATSANTASAIVARDSSGNFSAGTITANLTGNISGTAPAGTLTGTTLASNVVSSSLTSVGTLTSLTMTGDLTAGTSQLKLVASTGNLGIGTATPAYKLDVAGSANVSTGNTYKVNGTDVLSATTLGSGVTASSLTSVGTLTSLTVSGTTTTGAETIRSVDTSFARISGGNGAGTGANLIVFGSTHATAPGRLSLNAVGTGTIEMGAGGAIRATLDASGNLAVDTNTLYVDAANNRVGIGTASPSAALHVVGVARSDAGFIAALGATLSGFVGPTANWLGTGTDSNLAISAYGATGAVTFYTAGGSTERMRLDASGNLGLGVTPSAWSGYGLPVLELPASGTIVTQSSGATFGANWYYAASNFKYKTAGFASYYNQNVGQHRWFTAPSGSADANISGANAFVQAMTLDASGNLGVGTASPSGVYRVTIDGVGTASNPMGGISFRQGGTDVLYIGNTARDNTTDIEVWNPRNGFLRFATNNTERARITSGGYFKASNAGTYFNSTGSYHEFRSTTNDNGAIVVSHAGTSGTQYGISILTANDQNDATRYFWACEGGATTRATLRSNGGLANYSANDVNLASDERLKKDIAPLASTWDRLKAIEVVNYRYKDCNEGDPALYGVIAQQVQPIVPELVVVTREAVEAKDAELDEDGNEVKPAVEAAPEYYGIREQPMYWLAIKALQEAQARIEALEARLEALEA